MVNRRSFVEAMRVSAVATLVSWERVSAFAKYVELPARREISGAPPILLANNENPYGPAASALGAIRAACATGNRYPGRLRSRLVRTIAIAHGVREDHVLLAGGSGDILKASVYAYTSRTKALVTGSPSYESPMRSAQHIGAPLQRVPVNRDLQLNLAAMAASAVGAGLVYICNPNNPTSTAVPAADVATLVDTVARTSPGTHIIVDEAYIDYADMPASVSTIPLVARCPTLIVTRSMSKIHGMAGMRVGYAVAQPGTLARLHEHLSGSVLSGMSLSAAMASLADVANVETNRSMNRDVRAFTVDAFTRAGYRVAASDANFVFVNIKRDSRGFQEACRLRGVLVGRAFPPLTGWARISIGTQEEMRTAVPVFMEALAAPPRQTASLDHPDALPNEITRHEITPHEIT